MNDQEHIIWISTGKRPKRERDVDWLGVGLMVGIIGTSLSGFVLLIIEALRWV